MTKVLFIAYYFPPLGGAGVQRTLKHVRYLPEFGFQPVVVSSKGIYSNTFDEKMVSEIPADVKVIYLRAYSILNLKKVIRNKILVKAANFIQRIMLPDGYFLWYFLNRRRVLDLVKKEKIDILYTTSAPVSAHLFGLYLTRKIKNLVWISDFRDEWADNPEKKNSGLSLANNPVRNCIDGYYEKQVVEKANRIISVSKQIEYNFKRKYKQFGEKFGTIENGYDENDFSGLKPFPLQKQFEILYFGSLYGSRHSFYFLDAFSEFYKGLEDKDKVKVRFVGTIEHLSDFEKYCEDKHIREAVRIDGCMNHKDVLAETGGASVLILLIANGPGQNGVYTGKIFEYLRLDIPVLAMVPLDGAAAELVKKTNCGTVTEFSDAGGILAALSEMYKKWQSGTLFEEYRDKKNWEVVRSFERKKLSGQLASIFSMEVK